jgi:dihydroxy-acid dehydratase
VPDDELARRREAMLARGKGAWTPAQPRQRIESKALRAYARFATSAAFGAVRDVDAV